MNDSELDAKLRSVRAPERGGEFWRDFPERILAEARATQTPRPAQRRAWTLRFAWSYGLALACLAFGFWLGEARAPRAACAAVLRSERELRMDIRQFPGRLQTFMMDEHGLHKLIEDQS